VRASENGQSALIGSRPRRFQRVIDERWTLPLNSPKSGTKGDIAVFASKIQILLKEVCSKFICVKTSSGKLVASSFLYN